MPWEAEHAISSLRNADPRAALPMTCLAKSFYVAISAISISPPARRAPEPLRLRETKGMHFTCGCKESPAGRTQGDGGGCYCRPPGLSPWAVPFAGSGHARVSAPAPLSGSQSISLTHQPRCSRGCWSKDGLAFANRCQAVTEHLLFKRDFTVLDFMTFTA